VAEIYFVKLFFLILHRFKAGRNQVGKKVDGKGLTHLLVIFLYQYKNLLPRYECYGYLS